MRRNYIRLFIRLSAQIFCFLFLLGCLSQINVQTELTSGRLVVSGQISTISDQNFVELGRTAGTTRLPYPLEGAAVWLHDEFGNSYPWTEDPTRPGYFRLPDRQAAPGRSYYIRITLPEGSTYVSRPEKVPEVNASGEVYYEIAQKQFIDNEGTVSIEPFVDLYTNATFPESSEIVFVRWSVEESYVLRPTDFPDPFGSVPPPCYVVQSADPQRIVLANSRGLSGSTGNFLIASRHVDRSFHDRHFFTTYTSSISASAYDYWNKINVVANQVGSIFDTPPAEVTGNIFNADHPDENALGYFQATNQSLTRFFLVPDDFDFQISYRDCTYDPFRDPGQYPSECLNCLSLRNSSYNRPPWF